MAIDVTEADFEREVIERSHQQPVIVDFWAEWCAPCRTLGPTIERAVESRQGKVTLAKVDTDSNQGLSSRYGIRGIPAVKAFRDGEVVDEFVGAQSAVAVERFVDKLVPSEADVLVAAGDEQSLRRALELDPGRADAATKLARMLIDRSDYEGALRLVEPLDGDFLAQGLAARARLALASEDDDLREALEAGEHERALERLAEALEGADEERREQIRSLMVGIFTELGADHPLSVAYRRRLASALY